MWVGFVFYRGHQCHLSGSLAIRYSDFPGFRQIFGQPWPQNPSRATGLVLQCRLHQKSAPQTNSKAISWLLSGPLAFSDSRILPFGLGPETPRIRPRRAGFQPPGPGETFVFPWRGRRLQSRVEGSGGGPAWAPLGCPGESSKFSIIISPPPMDR